MASIAKWKMPNGTVYDIKANVSRYLNSPDTRSAIINPEDLKSSTGVQFDFKAAATINLTAANYSGVLTYRPYASGTDWTGGPAHQIAFNQAGLYWRTSTSNAWNNWQTLLTSSNYTTHLDNRYVNASGDTMTGNLRMGNESSFIGYMPRKRSGGGGWAYSPFCVKDYADNTFARFGVYGGENSLSYIYIGAGDYADGNNLRISSDGAATADRFYCSNWFRTYGACGWYSETYGGGIYMEDSTWIRTYNGKNFYCSATMGAGVHLYSDGDARISGNLLVSSNNATGGGIILSDDGDIVDMNDGYCSMRFSYGVRIFSGNRGGSPTITLYGPGGTVTGAVWNDYAEYRKSKIKEPGRCIIEVGDDSLILSTERLQKGAEIVSDTFGFAIGQTDDCQTPIAASGRVLAYGYEDREVFKSHIGDPVCSGPNGTVSLMTPEEEERYPSRIIGTVSAVPDYEIWGTGNIKVNNRIWIRIR